MMKNSMLVGGVCFTTCLNRNGNDRQWWNTVTPWSWGSLMLLEVLWNRESSQRLSGWRIYSFCWRFSAADKLNQMANPVNHWAHAYRCCPTNSCVFMRPILGRNTKGPVSFMVEPRETVNKIDFVMHHIRNKSVTSVPDVVLSCKHLQ